LDRDEVASLAKVRRIRPWQEEKRYLQALVLYSLSRSPPVFKGGTYLWFFHGLNRFSEDLDFTAAGSVDRKLVQDVRETLILFGVRNDVKMLKDDRYVLAFRIDARGPLYRSEKDVSRTNVEISRRESVMLAPIVLRLDEPRYGLPIVFLKGMDLREVVSEKIRALLTRTTARDLYDLWHAMVRLGSEPDMRLLKKKMDFYAKKYSYEELKRRINMMRDSWDKELSPVVAGELPDFDDVKEDILLALRGESSHEGSA